MHTLSTLCVVLGSGCLVILTQGAMTQGSEAAVPFTGMQMSSSGMEAQLAMTSYQRQSNTITLSRDLLDQPHRLTLQSENATRLRGQIQINGRTIKALNTETLTLDLAPYLKAGSITVTLTADYAPADAQIYLQFEGPETTISQQVSGAGQLDYQLVLEVR